MAPLKAADALAILQAAGTDARQAPAPSGMCRTLCYRVAGRPVNLGRLRHLACQAVPPHNAAAYQDACDRLKDRGVMITAGAIMLELVREAMAAPAPAPAAPAPLTGAAVVTAHLCRKFPVSSPETYAPAIARLEARGALVTPGAVLHEMERPAPQPAPLVSGPILPGETRPPATPKREGPAPTLPPVGRLTRPPGATLRGPWDPGTDEARAAVALRGERAATLWPIFQAIRGAGLALPGSWAPDGPVLNGERPYPAALASLSPDALRAAAVALATLPPVTLAHERALSLCRAALDRVAP